MAKLELSDKVLKNHFGISGVSPRKLMLLKMKIHIKHNRLNTHLEKNLCCNSILYFLKHDQKKELQVVMLCPEEETINSGLGEATQYHCTLSCAEFSMCQHGKLSCTEVFQEVQRACQEHPVCTNSLLSSVQAFILSVTLLLQKSLSAKVFSADR